MRLVLASRNEHKLSEFRSLLAPNEVLPLPGEVELPPETGATFSDNAVEKARAGAAGTGVACVADDSGIEASGLGGVPGVRSARFAGAGATDEENLTKLMAEVPDDGDRRVAYVCALAYVAPGASPQVVEGRCEGFLARAPRGDGGFGYDPAFLPVDDPAGRTMAELSAGEKHAISHRGRAARALLARLDDVASGR